MSLNRRKFIWDTGVAAGGLGTLLTLTGCLKVPVPKKKTLAQFIYPEGSDGEYDFDGRFVRGKTYDFPYVKKIKTRWLYRNRICGLRPEHKDKEKEILKAFGLSGNKFLVAGSSGIVYDGKILTVNHGISLEEGPFSNGIIEITRELIEQKTFVEKEEVKSIQAYPDYDLAILENPFPKSEHVRIGNSDELKPGHFIMAIGNTKGNGISVKTSRVSKTKAEKIQLSEEDLGKTKNQDYFCLGYTIFVGDSGGGVFAFRDGEPELVGMTKIVSPDGAIGFAHKINAIKEIIDL